MDKEEIFDLCKDNKKYLYVDAFVEVVKSKDGYVFSNTVDWAMIGLGWYDDDQLNDEILNIEPEYWGVTEEGWYMVHVLFTVHWDGDGYRDWTYLEPEIVEFNLQAPLEEVEKQMEELNKDVGLFDDLFGFIIAKEDLTDKI